LAFAFSKTGFEDGLKIAFSSLVMGGTRDREKRKSERKQKKAAKK
jgi:hypothetical protein